ncbi:MAG: type II toxin-antitoxin system VapC family toxin [Richelia sp. RM2_1_2]|nr:type II toxin-antitoxin system VapC family toxin [Richelia sp. SM1_7_0]NJN10501.1 type II toxin-antitoxin system VapC family toxin [Richelia sp. RM1_1_1]NJO59186.1 type II toxin-antitoxin system VapC family toxin [Richelia sp. RM2_1_2]
MRFLIDTHTFLWFIHDSPKLSANAKNLLESDNDLWVSIVSLWEIAIKVNISKLTLPNNYENFIPEQLTVNDIEILPIKMAHLAIYTTLPLHHRDPYDRLLIAQAMTEKVSIISADVAFDSYSVSRIW